MLREGASSEELDSFFVPLGTAVCSLAIHRRVAQGFLPRSLAILKIELAPNRAGTTRQQHWQEWVEAGWLEQVVSAHGVGLRKG